MNFIYRIERKISVLYYQKYLKNKFRFFGKDVFVINPLKIKGLQYISLKDNVHINYKSWLEACPLEGQSECVLQIGEGSVVGNFNHIYATQKIIIGKKVLIADKVYISDNLHGYQRIDVPIMDQPIRQNKEVIIDDGTWLGENVCVLGAKIGKNCVIGANSVVTKDIPDYSIAVGVPAKVIKKFNPFNSTWEKI